MRTPGFSAGGAEAGHDSRRPAGWYEAPDPGSGLGDVNLLQLVFRWKWPILAIAIAATVATGVIAWRLTPRYTAAASLVIDVRQVQIINAEQLLSNQMLDADLLHTEMAGFDSLRLAETVVDKLGLATDPEFCHPGSQSSAGWFGDLSALFKPSAVPAPVAACAASAEEIAKRLMASVSVSNDGRSYIIRVEAEADRAALAAAIANAYAASFIAERQAERAIVAEKARVWLSSYVTRLREQVVAADTAVAQYRNKYHLIPLRGETLASQSLVELNTQLTGVSNDLAQKLSVVGQLEALVSADGDFTAAVPMLNSPLIQDLLVREAETANRKAQLETQLGDAHPKVVEATAQLADLHRQIKVEVSKAVAGLGRDAAALSARKSSLSSEAADLQSRLGQQGDDDVELQGLVRDDDSARLVYQTSLTRLKEIAAQEGMEQSDARLVAEATAPDRPSYPRKTMMMVGAFLGSLGVGAGVALALSLLSRFFRDSRHLEAATGVRVLGLFPRPPDRSAPHDVAIDRPDSIEGEALHRILTNFSDLRPGANRYAGRVVLVTSAMAGDGKTSFGVALGRSAELAGLSTCLVDCDLRRPTVVSMLRESDYAIEAGATGEFRQHGLANASIVERLSGLTVLPVGGEGRINPHKLLGSPEMKALLNHLRSRHDLILLDTPPLLAVADALTLVALTDEIILLVDRSRTPRDAVADAIRMLRRAGGIIAGIVLSKVDLPDDGFGYRAYPRVAATARSKIGVPATFGWSRAQARPRHGT